MVKFISILKCFRKELNKEASELTFDEKLEVLNRLFLQSYITKKLGDRFFEIVSSMSYSEVKMIEPQLRSLIYTYPTPDWSKYIKFLDINYLNVEEKLELLSRFKLYPSEEYRYELLMSIYKKITTQEAKMALDNWDNVKERTKIIIFLLKENIHTSIVYDYIDKLRIKEEDLEETMIVLQNLPTDLRHIMLFNNFCFRPVFDDNSKYSKYISKAEKDFFDRTILDKELEFIEDREYLREYNELLKMQLAGELKDYRYTELKIIEKDKLYRLRTLVEDDTPLAKEFDSMIKNSESTFISIIPKFKSLEEKLYYYLNTPTALDNSYLFTDIAELITKEQIVEKIKSQKLNSIPDWIKSKFTQTEFLELFKLYPNSFGEYAIVDFCFTASAKNIINCLEIFPDLKISSLQSLFDKMHSKVRNNYNFFGEVKPKTLQCHLLEAKEELYAYIEKALIRENYTKKSFYLWDAPLSELKFIKENYPNLYKVINYSFGSIDLASSLDYFETFKDEKEFLYEIYNQYKGDLLDAGIRIKIITALFDVSDEYEIMRMFENIKREDYKGIYQLLDNEKKLLFIKYMRVNYEDYPKDVLDYYLLTLEHGKEILELYQTINESNRSKIEKSDLRDNTVSRHRSMFKENISVIAQNLEVLKELVLSNPTVLFTINYAYLDIFEGKDLEFFTRYEKRLYKLKDNNKKVCRRIIKIIKDNSTFSEEFIDICMDKAEKFEGIEELSDEELEKLIYYIVTNPYLFQSKSPIKEIILNIDSSKIELADRLISDPTSTIEDIKNAILIRYFHTNIYKGTTLVKEYEASIDELLKAYENKELNAEGFKEYKTLLYFKQIKNIINTDDKELLIMLYNEMSIKAKEELPLVNYMDLLMLEQTLKTIYTKDIKSNIYKPNKKDYKTTINYQGTSIEVYEPTDEFNMLMTVVGAYVKNNDAKINPKEAWNDEDKKVNHGICTSLISQDNLSMAPLGKNPLIYGFYNIEDNSIQKAANYDICSNSNSIQIRAGRLSSFRTTRNMIDNTRTGHNELVLERRLAAKGKRQPDFIVALSPITDLVKQAAAQFNVPIILLDIEKIAKREHDKLIDIISKLSVDMDESLLKCFITKYHNNYTGYISNFKNICRKYYDPKVFKKYFEKIVTLISNIENEEERIAASNTYLKYLVEEENKRLYTEKEYIPFEFTSIKASLESIISKRELKNTNKIKKGI